MRRLSGVTDDTEDLAFGEVEDRQPVIPGAARAGVAVVKSPGRLPRSGWTFLGAHAHGADDPAAEARVGLEVPAKFPLDGSAFQGAGAPPNFRGRKPAPFLDAVEQGLAGRDRRLDQGHAGRERRPDEFDRARPLDVDERGVNRHDLVSGHDPRQQDRHRLAVLAAAGRDRHESAGPDHVPALGGKADVGVVGGHGSVSRLAARETALWPPDSPGRCWPLPLGGAGPACPAAKATNAGRPASGRRRGVRNCGVLRPCRSDGL